MLRIFKIMPLRSEKSEISPWNSALRKFRVASAQEDRFRPSCESPEQGGDPLTPCGRSVGRVGRI